MTVRPLAPGDIESILAIQSVTPEIARWPREDYTRITAAGHPSTGESFSTSSAIVGWSAEKNAKVVGFLLARCIGRDVELLNIAVRPDDRSAGIGAALLNNMLAWCAALRAEKVLLEVRASNKNARRFYERHGFQVTGRRPRYYVEPIDDALLLTLDLGLAIYPN